MLAVTAAGRFHFGGFKRRALLRNHPETAAIEEHGPQVAMEQNAAAFLKHGLRIALAILVGGDEAGVLVGHL